MHVMVISEIVDANAYWGALKRAYSRLPKGAKWALAVASTDGTKAVNVLVHDSVDDVRAFFDDYAAQSATSEYFEADAANAVGLPR